ncbi:MAG: acyl-CoA dehydrogenase, partial [SAR324 cluster bacterium]|nr:acyl-CoA dehydrogenase [SAR324 cluster bacterium]
SMDPAYGGQGLPELIATAARETQLAANQGFCIANVLTTGAANLILAFGTKEQKQVYCEKMLRGEWSGTMCLTEPQAGSAVGEITSTASKQPEGHYLIKGTKVFITYGEHDMADNIVHLLLARTGSALEGTKGISLFIVPKARADGTLNDVTLVHIESKMGLHGSPTCMLSFGENANCHGYLLQEENTGMAQMFQMMNEARLYVALQGLGGAAAALQNAWAYANERSQGPSAHPDAEPGARALIKEHPDVRRMLMHMKAVTEGLRGLCYAAAWYADWARHGPEASREHYQNLLDLHIPICKGFSTDQGFEVGVMGQQVLGGVGYLKDFPLEQNVRDQKISSIYEGTNGIQALDLVGRKFTVDNGKLLESLAQELGHFDECESAPELQRLVNEWKAYRTLMFDSMANLRRLGEQGGKPGYVLYACNMLALMGDVLSAFYLLRQAEVAQRKWQTLTAGKDSDTLLESSEEARFLWNKLRTVEFHISSVLPRALSHARIIENANLAPLDALL